MRISDLSSDVCSSDLCRHISTKSMRAASTQNCSEPPPSCGTSASAAAWNSPSLVQSLNTLQFGQRASSGRSEEHTSELQSLMRISYAVFCLKKKNKLN